MAQAQTPYTYLQDSKRNNFWLTGYDSEGSVQFNDTTFGNACLDFNHAPLLKNRCLSELDLCVTNASICDTSGNLVAFTNGIWIANKNLVKMHGAGDTINKGYACRFMLNQISGNRSYRTMQSAIFLPRPNYVNQYYLFHVKSGEPPYDPAGIERCEKLLYSIVLTFRRFIGVKKRIEKVEKSRTFVNES